MLPGMALRRDQNRDWRAVARIEPAINSGYVCADDADMSIARPPIGVRTSRLSVIQQFLPGPRDVFIGKVNRSMVAKRPGERGKDVLRGALVGMHKQSFGDRMNGFEHLMDTH